MTENWYYEGMSAAVFMNLFSPFLFFWPSNSFHGQTEENDVANLRITLLLEEIFHALWNIEEVSLRTKCLWVFVDHINDDKDGEDKGVEVQEKNSAFISLLTTIDTSC